MHICNWRCSNRPTGCNLHTVSWGFFQVGRHWLSATNPGGLIPLQHGLASWLICPPLLPVGACSVTPASPWAPGTQCQCKEIICIVASEKNYAERLFVVKIEEARAGWSWYANMLPIYCCHTVWKLAVFIKPPNNPLPILNCSSWLNVISVLFSSS